MKLRRAAAVLIRRAGHLRTHLWDYSDQAAGYDLRGPDQASAR
jgi:hypothetical protein